MFKTTCAKATAVAPSYRFEQALIVHQSWVLRTWKNLTVVAQFKIVILSKPLLRS
jgi:hypothetical protein